MSTERGVAVNSLRRITSQLGAPGMLSVVVANYSAVGGQAVRTLLLAKILAPASFGTLNITNIGSNLTTYADIGTGMHAERLAAQARGRDEPDESKRILIQAARSRMVPAWILLCTLGAAAALATALGNETLTLALSFLAASAPLMSLWMACRGWLHVHGAFRWMMYCQLTQVLVWLTAVPIASYLWGLRGALASMAASYLPPILCASVKMPVWRFLLPDWRSFIRWIPGGAPLWFIQLMSFVFINVDQAIISITLDQESVGFYAIAMLTSTALLAFSDAAAMSGHMRTLEHVARVGYLSPTLPSVTRVMQTVQVGFIVLVPLSWVAAGLLTAVFLTQYTASLVPLLFLGVGASLMGVVVASNSALLSLGRHVRLPFLYLSAIAVKISLALLLVRWLPSLVTIAVVSLIGSLVVAIGWLILLSRAFERPRRSGPALLAQFLRGAAVLTVMAISVAWAYDVASVRGFLVASLCAALMGLCITVVIHRRQAVSAYSDDGG